MDVKTEAIGGLAAVLLGVCAGLSLKPEPAQAELRLGPQVIVAEADLSTTDRPQLHPALRDAALSHSAP